MPIETKFIEGTKPEPETLLELQKSTGLPTDKSIMLSVFEMSHKGKVVYCCWAGGALDNGQPRLTLVGKAAVEALINLPLGSNAALIFQELKIGPTPLKEKVRAAFARAEPGAKICFIGDLQGELDGEFPRAFNLVRGSIKVSH